MRNNTRHLLLSVLTLIIGFAGTVAAQQEQNRTSVRLTSGLTIIFTSETDPPGHDRNAFGSIQVRGEDNTVHRIFVDRKNSLYFGYDLKVEPVPSSDQFRLTIKPLSAPPISPADAALHARATAGSRSVGAAQTQSDNLRPTDLTPRALPKYPPPQLIHDGDTLALDVLVNSRTGVTIIDLIKVSFTGESSQASFPSGILSARAGGQTATNLTPESVEFRMTNSWLLVNDQKVIGMEESDGLGVSGSLIWFYLPGYGRFILSLTAREGYDFQKAGVVEGRKLSFNMDGNRFEWVSSSSIVPSVGVALNLWVLHDSQYQPDVVLGPSPYRMGAANNIKNLIAKD